MVTLSDKEEMQLRQYLDRIRLECNRKPFRSTLAANVAQKASLVLKKARRRQDKESTKVIELELF